MGIPVVEPWDLTLGVGMPPSSTPVIDNTPTVLVRPTLVQGYIDGNRVTHPYLLIVVSILTFFKSTTLQCHARKWAVLLHGYSCKWGATIHRVW